MKIGKRYLVGLIILVADIVAVAVAATLFTHTFPAFQPTLVASQCGNANLADITFPGTPSGTIRWKCAVGVPAFTRSTTPGTVTPGFDLTGTGYTAVSFVATAAGGCTAGSPVTSGTGLDLVALPAGSYDYCLSYNSVSGLGSFTLTWGT